MTTLDALLRDRPTMSLDELSDTANRFLADLVADIPSDARVKPEVNGRLIRHYVSEGMIDPAVRNGRHVVYGVDQLLQLLALRRLLSDGVPSAAIGSRLLHQSRDRLRDIAESRASFDDLVRDDPSDRPSMRFSSPPPPDPTSRRTSAAEVVASIRERAGIAPSAAASTDASSRTGATLGTVGTWERLVLHDGVELHIRQDVQLPRSSIAQRTFLDGVVQAIVMHTQSRHSRS